jgi:hypothetical protein
MAVESHRGDDAIAGEVRRPGSPERHRRESVRLEFRPRRAALFGFGFDEPAPRDDG